MPWVPGQSPSGPGSTDRPAPACPATAGIAGAAARAALLGAARAGVVIAAARQKEAPSTLPARRAGPCRNAGTSANRRLPMTTDLPGGGSHDSPAAGPRGSLVESGAARVPHVEPRSGSASESYGGCAVLAATAARRAALKPYKGLTEPGGSAGMYPW